jgi:hypothetical protein
MNVLRSSRFGRLKSAAVAGAAVFSLAMATAPASAADLSTGAGNGLGGGVVITTVNVGHNLTATGTYTGQLLGVNSILIEYACGAASWPDPASTGVDCSINGQDTLGMVTLPGASSAAAGDAIVSIFDLINGVHLCVTADATYVENRLGASYISRTQCS